MWDSLRTALIVTRREMRDQFRDWRVIFPVVVLTVLFPWLMNFTASQAVAFVNRYGAPLVAQRLMPFLLLMVGFFPSTVSLVIALESFVGEMERRSIEPLFSSPLSDLQLYLGKLLAAMVVPIGASYLGILVYLVGVYWRVGWRPEPLLLFQVFLLSTVQSVLMVSGAMVISTQTTSVRAANLLSSFVIIPMAFLIQGEAMVMFWAQYSALWLAILGQLIVAGMLVRTGVAYFNREELLGRELDNLNLGSSWSRLRSEFLSEARTPWEWYRRGVFPAVRRLAIPVGMMAAALVIGLWAGTTQVHVLVFPAERLEPRTLAQGFALSMNTMPLLSASGAGLLWLHNLRAMLLASFLGIFSFGVLGIVILLLPMMIIGYLSGTVVAAGMSPLPYLVGLVLPHGMLEIPAILLAGAAIFGLGGVLLSPARGKKIGEAWLGALADWGKIMLGLVAPLLLGAAFMEALVTPRVALWIFGG